jgi:hypothetical protein
MKQRVPTAVLVMAILNFVFGGIGLLMSGCGGAFTLFLLVMPEQKPGQPGYFPNVLKTVAKEVPGYTAFMTASLVMGLVLSTVLIIAGIGLLRLRPWAWWLCILYAPLQILLQVGILYCTLVYVNPVMHRANQEVFRQLPPGAPNFAATDWLGDMGTFAGAVFGMAYPIALLVMLFLPHVRDAFDRRRGPPQVVDIPEVG